jgi:glycosyltransferase involved in cell wall biosynthesis
VDFRNDLLLIGDTTDKISDSLEMLMDENTRKEYGNKLRKEIEEKYNTDIEVKKLIKLYNEYTN